MGILDTLLGINWRDSLQDASFRGKKFFVSSTDTGIGRRNIVHQYPFRDIPYVEDLGRDANEFVVNGYVIANKDNSYNHLKERDILIKALREEGPGDLIHPFYGFHRVSLVGKARITESFEEGGITRFQMTFVQAGQNRYPVKDTNTVDSMDAQAEAAEQDMQDSFGNKFQTAAAIGSVLTGLASATKKLYAAQRKIMAAIQGGPRALLSTALGYVDSSAASTVDSAMANACTTASIILSSMDAFNMLGGTAGTWDENFLTGLCSGAIRERKGGLTKSTTAKPSVIEPVFGKSIVKQMMTLQTYGDDFDPVVVTSVNSAQAAINYEHLKNIGRNFGLTTISKIAVRIDFTSRNEANEIMTLVADAYDAQLEALGDNASSSLYNIYGLSVADDESFIALQEARKVFIKAMMAIAAKLPSLFDYQVPTEVLPALVLAYNQYEDLDRENEIITRNQVLIPHPGFLPNGDTIELLSV